MKTLVSAILFLCAATASAQDVDALDGEQRLVYEMVRQEARRQNVPVEFVLAVAEIETRFRDKSNKKKTSFGPLQVDKSALFPAEHSLLPNMVWNVAKGVAILRDLLKKSKGRPLQARRMYVCGPRPDTSCSPEKLRTIESKWSEAVVRWRIARRYDV